MYTKFKKLSCVIASFSLVLAMSVTAFAYDHIYTIKKDSIDTPYGELEGSIQDYSQMQGQYLCREIGAATEIYSNDTMNATKTSIEVTYNDTGLAGKNDWHRTSTSYNDNVDGVLVYVVYTEDIRNVPLAVFTSHTVIDTNSYVLYMSEVLGPVNY